MRMMVRFVAGSLIAAVAAAGIGGCIFGVETSTTDPMDAGTADASDVDPSTAIDAGECAYRGKDQGVCLMGEVVADAGSTDADAASGGIDENGCKPPDSWEFDEQACDEKDNDCDGVTDEGCFCIFRGMNEGVCVNGIRAEDGSCEGPGEFAERETDAHCDGKDNDCNGEIDEECTCTAGETQPCYNGPAGTAGTGVCEEGTLECIGDSWSGECMGETTPESEQCNEKDDNCDGSTDEGCSCDYDTTSEGVCSGGTIGAQGNCKKPNDYQADETKCGGKDNDCDGVTDEDCYCSYEGRSTGVCSNGTIDASDGSCTQPGDYEDPESSCDSKDNDCDGATDGSDSDLICSCTPNETESCYTGRSGTEGEGMCDSGTKKCKNDSTWGTCKNETTPGAEGGGGNCEGKDNDCDGYTDEGCPCNYQTTSAGVCANQIRGSMGKCPKPNGYKTSESNCSDALDNDCDGSEDCGDSDCDGKACGMGTGAGCQNQTCIETACNDGDDNDQDSATDCADGDCRGASCGSGSGAECSSGSCTELRCGDGINNDGDTDTDCEDGDCDGVQCSGSGTSCLSVDDTCHETACSDDQDNELDGKVDECDSDCSGTCGAGASCPDKSAGVCSEMNCEDEIDNDQDGNTDCGDSACSRCGAGTTCSGSTCVETNCGDGDDNDDDGGGDCKDNDCSSCGSGTTCSGHTCVETDCADGVDNDGDGGTDCADVDCDGEFCGPGSGAACHNKRCAEIDCTDGSNNDGDSDTDDADTEDCNQSGREWCHNDNQCARGVCVQSSECAQTMFATSVTFPDADFGSVSVADSKCGTAASNASLPGTWKAVLSTSSDHAKNRLTVGTEVYNTNGDLLASGSGDLWTGSLSAAVGYDESGTAVSGSSWTGTTNKGEVATCTSGMNVTYCTCSNWSSGLPADPGVTGNVTQSSGSWIDEKTRACDTRGLRLYCIDGQ